MSDDSLKQHIGEEIKQFFILRSVEIRHKKSDNSPYAVLELGYPHGRIWANIWENTAEFTAEYGGGDVVKIQGKIEQYRETTQINIKRIRKALPSDEVYPEDLLPQYPGDTTQLVKRLEKLIN